MTPEELKAFIEERLQDYDSLIDLSAGSDAQTRIVAPLLARLNQDVFDTDISAFIKDRLWQEFRMSITDGDGVSDTFILPHRTVMEPFKRALTALKRDQSARYPEQLTEEGADAIGANWFAPRIEGDFASVIVRIYFSVPTAQTVTPSIRFFTSSGLNFFPAEVQAISSEQMLLQRSGNSYYMDVVVRAENAGDEYNVGPDEITGVEGLGNSIRVTNPRKASPGRAREDSVTYLTRVSESLTERSLTSDRGNRARLNSVFEDIVSMETVGMNDPEMQRDILRAETDGDLFSAGNALSIRQYLLVFDAYENRGSDGTVVPEVGDKIVLNYAPPWHLNIPWADRNEELTITNILFSSFDAGFTGWPGIFLFELDRLPVPEYMTWFPWLTRIYMSRFALYRPGMITVSGLPGGIMQPNTADGRLKVQSNEIHMGGHYDVWLRPASVAEESLTLDNLTDSIPLIGGSYLRTFGASATPNVVDGLVDGALADWIKLGARPGMVITIGSGLDAGSYKILDVQSDKLVLSSNLTATETGLLFRLVDELNVDLTNPAIMKLPLGRIVPSDLSTTMGSSTVQLSSTNLYNYNVEVGDIFRIEEGLDAGDYTIVGFDEMLAGRGPILDSELLDTSSNLHYSVYATQEGIQLPLVRISSVELMDSRGQPSGTAIPYALPVMAANRCCFTGSEHYCDGLKGMVVPDLSAGEPVDAVGCPEPHEWVYDVVTNGVNINNVWYTLSHLCTETDPWKYPSADPPSHCIPDINYSPTETWLLKVKQAFLTIFTNEGEWETSAPSTGWNSGWGEPKTWDTIKADLMLGLDAPFYKIPSIHREDGALCVSLWRIILAFQYGQIKFYSNGMLQDNHDNGDGNIIAWGEEMIWQWLVKERDTWSDSSMTTDPEDIGPFRVRRHYSDGCEVCDGHVICVCLDYNTQFELCLPKGLFDGCNNMFIGFPEVTASSLLDYIETAVEQALLINDTTGTYETETIDYETFFRNLIPPPCLCSASPGDVLTLPTGPNAGNYFIESMHEIKLDLGLIFDEGEQERLLQVLGSEWNQSQPQYDKYFDIAGGAGVVGVPFSICLVKIEGEFPAPKAAWFSKLLANPVTLSDLIGDYAEELLSFVSIMTGASVESVTELWNIYSGVDLKEIFEDSFGISLKVPFPGAWGCQTGPGPGLLERVWPKEKLDTWSEWTENAASASGGLDPAVLAFFLALLRRMSAFGISPVLEYLSPAITEDPVLSMWDPTTGLPTCDPSTEGGRYLSTGTALGWTENYIYECDGAGGWIETAPYEYAGVRVESPDNIPYSYRAASGWSSDGTSYFNKLLDTLNDRGYNTDALVYGGSLSFSPVWSFFENTWDTLRDSIVSTINEVFPQLGGFVEAVLVGLGSAAYLLIFMPLLQVWEVATEHNLDLIPEKMYIDLAKVMELIRELLFTPYGVGKPICDNYIRTYFMEPTTVEFDAGLGLCNSALPSVPSMFVTRHGGTELLFSAAASVDPFTVVPAMEETATIDDLELPREIEVYDPTVLTDRNKLVFTDASLGSPAANGVQAGRDVIELFQQRFILPAPRPKSSHTVLDKDLSSPPASPDDGDAYIVGAAGGDTITVVDLVTPKFTIDGDHVTIPEILVGMLIRVRNSTGNDGWYTVGAPPVLVAGPATEITTLEPIPDATADGTLHWTTLGTLWASSDIGPDIVVQWDDGGGSWTAEVPSTDEFAWVDDENAYYRFSDGAAWVLWTEVFLNKNMLPGLKTTRNSPIVEIPDDAFYGWTPNMVGELLFIERGDDAGGYRIVKFYNGKKVELDRPLAYSTMENLKSGYNAGFDFSAGDNTFRTSADDDEFVRDDIGRYVTIYGNQYPIYNGAYAIDDFIDSHTVRLDLGGGSIAGGEVMSNGMWLLTDAPAETPEIYSDGSRETLGVVPFRQYSGEPALFSITLVEPSLDVSLGIMELSYLGPWPGPETTFPRDGRYQPFRIVRPGVQRFSSTQMAENVENGLYYVDVKIRSLGSGAEYNLPEDVTFWPVFGSFRSDGYRYVVADVNYTFSPEEQVGIIISPTVLPVGAEDRPDAAILLSGQTIQVNYEHAPTVMNVHQFIRSRRDRTLLANPLARHYLPAYTYIFASYRGGADPDELATEISEYIRSLGPLDALQVDQVEAFISRSGADYIEHPLLLRAVILDMRRNWTAIESRDYLHSNVDDPEFLGSDRLTYFIPGEDTSRLTEMPAGPQTRLTKVLTGPVLR